ncbi:MAG: ABC transporter substrate binding protein [Nitrospirales bacterium]
MNSLFPPFQRSIHWVKLARVILFLGIFLGLSEITHAEEVAILKSADITAYSEAIVAFKTALPPAFQVTLEYDLQGDMAKGRSLARRIRASDAQVVLAVGLKAAIAAKLEILDIPVLFCLVLNPEKYGLPTSNMMGLSMDIPFRKHLKPLQLLIPKVSRIGVIFDPEKTTARRDKLQDDAKALGITILSQEVNSEQEVSEALKSLGTRIEALWLLPDSTVLTKSTLDFLMSTTLEMNIPVVGFSAGIVKSGAVVSAHLNYEDIGKQAATTVQNLLGRAPHPVLGTILPPDRIHQSINQKAAQFLGFSLTPDILRAFDEQY